MKVRWICAALCGLILSGATGVAQAQIAATVLRDVVVDGSLDEWPDHLEQYPIRNHSGVYGSTDIDDKDLSESDDLSPSFRVGYDPDENLLYVGVEVRDNDLVVSNDSRETDACEVYVYGGRDGDRGFSNPLQYVMVPGGGLLRWTGKSEPDLVRDWPDPDPGSLFPQRGCHDVRVGDRGIRKDPQTVCRSQVGDSYRFRRGRGGQGRRLGECCLGLLGAFNGG